MKKKIIALLGVGFVLMATTLQAEQILLAQAPRDEDDFLMDDEDDFDEESQQRRLEEERKRREEEEKRRQEEERRRQEEEARKLEEAKRASIRKQQLQERKAAEAKTKEIDAMRESSADTTEYTLNPESVQMVVEMDPNGYGFRTRNHRMTMSAEIDYLLRGRSVLHYDFRFFNYLSAGLVAGLDYSDMSIYSRFRDHLTKPSPKQLTVLWGLTSKWRVTEWYMRSSLFLEPSLLFGYMWQTIVTQHDNFWRMRPGLYGGVETVFDSGLAVTTRIGAEFPIDFGGGNPVTELVEPVLMIGFGFAI